MHLKKIVFLLILFALCYNFGFAGPLVSDEAGNYFNEGLKAQEAGNFETAEINYQKTLILAPHSLKWKKYIYNNYGVMFAQLGDPEQAELSFNKALEIDPQYQPAILNLGLITDKRKTRLESLEYWAKVFELDKQKPRDFTVSIEEKQTEK